MLNGRHCAEQAEKAVRIVRGGLEMVLVEYIDQQCSAESSEHLGCGVRQKLRPGELACNGEAETHGRVEMGPGIRACNEDSAHDCEAPGHCDYYPSRSLGL